MKHFLSVALLVFLAFAGEPVLSQITLYVNPVTGSDSNSGVAQSPLKTIGAATRLSIANTQKKLTTTIMLNRGTYRETVSVGGVSGQANIKLAAITPGTAIVSGSDVLAGWTSIGNGEYTHSWQDPLPVCALPAKWPPLPAIALHNEMVFVNGTPLTQIINKSDHRLGTFYVDRNAKMLHAWSTTNLTSALVEAAGRPQTLQVHNTTGLVVSGIVFKNAGSCMNTSSVNIDSSTHALLDNLTIQWNNWEGIAVEASNDVILQNSRASYNGGQGYGGFNNANIKLTSVEASYNNWRGAMGAFYDFGMGGVKFGHLHGAQITGLTAYNNYAEGLWFDTDNKDVNIQNTTLTGNAVSNLKIEASQGPFAVTNSSLCSSGIGVVAFDVSGVSLIGNNIYNNGNGAKWEAEIFIAGQPNGRTFTDFQTGQHYTTFTTNTTMSNNIITDGRPNQNLFGTYFSGITWTNFIKSFHSNGNIWHDGFAPTPFLVPNGQHDSLSGWQNLTGQDANSSTTASSEAARNCTAPSPAYSDFMMFAENHDGEATANQVLPYFMSHGVVAIPLQVKSYGYGAIALSTSALPSGISASFSAATLQSGTSLLTIKASSHAATETIPVTVFGASGSRVHSVTFLVGARP